MTVKRTSSTDRTTRRTTRERGRAAADRRAGTAARVAAPEQVVVTSPPPDPDYPRFRVDADRGVRLADVDPDESEHYARKKDVADELAKQRKRIRNLQARLYGEHQRSLLMVLQAMDTGGKDGTIKGVFQGVNPQGCQVWSFKAPSADELDHDFLWRYHARVPGKGMINIFNRSHYEDVLIVRVKGLVPEAVWRPRYEAINQFEYALTMSGVIVIKFYLHLQGRAEAAAGEPPDRPGQALEVLLQRPQGARPLGRLPGRLRGRHQQLLDPVRPLVRHPNQHRAIDST